jgi:aminoglycoside phosphotransferase (APT) family kinase protein
MALANKTDPKVAERNLTSWLAGKLDGARDLRVSDLDIPRASGMSNETILFDASWREGSGRDRRERLVARVAPSGASVFPEKTLATEYRVMKTLGEKSAVPVPRVHWIEEDASVLGAPFVVMGRVDGRVPADDPPFTATGWVLELTLGEQARMVDNGIAVLAAIHAVDWRALGLDFLARPDLGDSPLDQQIAWWKRCFEWAAEGEANPTIEAAFRWIEGNRPKGEPVVLNWGDARIGNMIFPADLSVAAVLDWEMVSLASPELDLGWSLFLLRHHTEGIGAPLPAGFPSRERMIARYEELSSFAVRHIDFYEAFAALRLSILMHRAGNLMIAAGLLPAGATMKLSNPASQLLAKLLGLPAPAGAVQSFIGNR